LRINIDGLTREYNQVGKWLIYLSMKWFILRNNKKI
jgi:hypothetical protein